MVAGGVAEASTESGKEVVVASGVCITSTQAGKEVVGARSGVLTSTGPGKEVVATSQAGSCGQATHIVSGATYGYGTSATYYAAIDIQASGIDTQSSTSTS